MTTKTRFVYRFRDGNAGMRDLLGGKGANLCEMARLGLPIPPGFVVSTDGFREFARLDQQLPESLWQEVQEALKEVEEAVGRRFGDPDNPLLVSVRSGSKFSMPGMMDTILNLGLNDETVEGLAKAANDRRFALDSYRRFIQLFAKVALHTDADGFEKVLDEARTKAGATSDADLSEADLEDVIRRFKEIASTGTEAFPTDTLDQLRIAISAVFESWTNPRAIAYRNHQHIPHDLGTAVSIMAMVFGNTGPRSGTGVCFTRNPSTGERALYGEYLPNAQGEDIVSGVRTPKPISELESEMPDAYGTLIEHAKNLENHFRDVQDIEFTIENGRLFILQTRSGKRTAMAAVKTAVDMVGEGLISRDEALLRVPADELSQLLLPRFDDESKERAAKDGRLLGTGLNASPGAATGIVAIDGADAERYGERAILVRPETSADDMPAILKAGAVLTSRGGITSHAAVVTRGLGKPAVVGLSAIDVDTQRGEVSVDGTVLKTGDAISIDGFTGEVFSGTIDTVPADISSNDDLRELLNWADAARRLEIRANADTPEDAARARSFGAHGIGLCRTEHMFFQEERLVHIREMLMNTRHEGTETANGTQANGVYDKALKSLEEYQTSDFRGILEAMDGLPVVIRLLDAPLHEFLPPIESLIENLAIARVTNGPEAEVREMEELLEAARSLAETNPMLGHRGSRLGVTNPDIYEMQVRAIYRATKDLIDAGKDPQPEIMVPLVMGEAEVKSLKARLTELAKGLGEDLGRPARIHFGTMIEVPRAALDAGAIAPHVDFFSFGSNDLTQMTFGFSRDDAEEKFLRYYVENEILPRNPFATIDEKGVGRLIEIAVKEGRKGNASLQLGLCGEHGGDPLSIDFCHRVGLDYVSCSPPRVAVARLAAAQAAIGQTERDV
ncbi:MAG: pyruvate, phosphate dikinase [Chloroflexi bacterium]|nr:pyruvate, phosphate dikinase [Chloroflexota bacterium]